MTSAPALGVRPCVGLGPHIYIYVVIYMYIRICIYIYMHIHTRIARAETAERRSGVGRAGVEGKWDGNSPRCIL